MYLNINFVVNKKSLIKNCTSIYIIDKRSVNMDELKKGLLYQRRERKSLGCSIFSSTAESTYSTSDRDKIYKT